MKEVLFTLLVILLTPLYFSMYILKATAEIISDFTAPFAEGIKELIENMMEFWKGFLK